MRIRHFACVVGLAFLFSAAAIHADEVRLHMDDGRTINGTFVSEDENTITVNVAGIPTTFQRSSIRRVERLQSVPQQYAERRAQIANDDINARYALIYWVYQQKEYDLALRELNQLAKDAPDDARVATLREAIQQAQASRRTPTTPTTPAQPQAQPVAPGTDEQIDSPMLTDDQINLIKVYEIDLATRPPVVVPREAIDRIFAEYADKPETPKGREAQNAFRRAPGWQQLRLIFELRARELYPLVRVRTDPEPLARFRREIHNTYVVSYCAAARCHGGTEGGDLILFRDARRPEAQAYTNFFILSQYENQHGRMINRNDPARSLLLQYGLERRAAQTPHPEVPGWRPQFHSTDAERFRVIADWISTLYPNPPANYDIDYTPPGKAGRQEEATEDAPTAKQ